MYRLFIVLKARITLGGSSITDEEVEIAAGRKVLDSCVANKYLFKLESTAQRIVDAFWKQVEDAAVSTYSHWKSSASHCDLDVGYLGSGTL